MPLCTTWNWFSRLFFDVGVGLRDCSAAVFSILDSSFQEGRYYSHAHAVVDGGRWNFYAFNVTDDDFHVIVAAGLETGSRGSSTLILLRYSWRFLASGNALMDSSPIQWRLHPLGNNCQNSTVCTIWRPRVKSVHFWCTDRVFFNAETTGKSPTCQTGKLKA